ncbi:hypothetical protein T07_14253 [Trichinella nelsoni]|uniref:Uncharacterized protein n=1 Tax=Trichinella nelsoni TaxID=6336 RepID=A0A0V0RG00_9BILA|nr:hypothetical protein T07_14253 [Trichinella nelsoni]
MIHHAVLSECNRRLRLLSSSRSNYFAYFSTAAQISTFSLLLVVSVFNSASYKSRRIVVDPVGSSLFALLDDDVGCSFGEKLSLLLPYFDQLNQSQSVANFNICSSMIFIEE